MASLQSPIAPRCQKLSAVLARRRQARSLDASRDQTAIPNLPLRRPHFGESTQPILTTTGVRDMLRNGVDLVIVRPGQIIDIRKRCMERYRESVPRRVDVYRWRIGDVISVPYGPFVGIPVQITAIDKSGRVGASIGNLDVTFHVTMAGESVRGRQSPALNPQIKACLIKAQMSITRFYHKRTWLKARRQALYDAGYQCQRCGVSLVGKGKAAHVHHRKPLAKAPALATEPLNLQALCVSCHDTVHHAMKRKPACDVYGRPLDVNHPSSEQSGGDC